MRVGIKKILYVLKGTSVIVELDNGFYSCIRINDKVEEIRADDFPEVHFKWADFQPFDNNITQEEYEILEYNIKHAKIIYEEVLNEELRKEFEKNREKKAKTYGVKRYCVFVTENYKSPKSYKFYAAFEDEDLVVDYIRFLHKKKDFHDPGKFIVVEECFDKNTRHNTKNMKQVIGPLGDCLMVDGKWRE